MAERKKRKKQWFIKDVGRGSIRLRSGKKVKPNEKIFTTPDDIPEAHRDTVHPVKGSWDNLDQVDEEEEKQVEQEVEQQGQYYKQERSPGWFDVLDPQGKPVNEKAVRESEADDWVKSLNA